MKMKHLKKHEPYVNFKGWLISNSLKYDDISKLLCIATSTVSNKINGFSDFRLSEVLKITTEYGTNSDIFFIKNCKR